MFSLKQSTILNKALPLIYIRNPKSLFWNINSDVFGKKQTFWNINTSWPLYRTSAALNHEDKPWTLCFSTENKGKESIYYGYNYGLPVYIYYNCNSCLCFKFKSLYTFKTSATNKSRKIINRKHAARLIPERRFYWRGVFV